MHKHVHRHQHGHRSSNRRSHFHTSRYRHRHRHRNRFVSWYKGHLHRHKNKHRHKNLVGFRLGFYSYNNETWCASTSDKSESHEHLHLHANQISFGLHWGYTWTSLQFLSKPFIVRSRFIPRPIYSCIVFSTKFVYDIASASFWFYVDFIWIYSDSIHASFGVIFLDFAELFGFELPDSRTD